MVAPWLAVIHVFGKIYNSFVGWNNMLCFSFVHPICRTFFLGGIFPLKIALFWIFTCSWKLGKSVVLKFLLWFAVTNLFWITTTFPLNHLVVCAFCIWFWIGGSVSFSLHCLFGLSTVIWDFVLLWFAELLFGASLVLFINLLEAKTCSTWFTSVRPVNRLAVVHLFIELGSGYHGCRDIGSSASSPEHHVLASIIWF